MAGTVFSGPQTSFTNAATLTSITLNNATFSGNLGNTGTITGRPYGSMNAIFIAFSTVDGAISNAGTISANGGAILVGYSSVVLDGIVNAAGAKIISNDAGGIVIGGVPTFGGGISNAGTISGVTGILVNNVPSFGAASAMPARSRPSAPAFTSRMAALSAAGSATQARSRPKRALSSTMSRLFPAASATAAPFRATPPLLS